MADRSMARDRTLAQTLALVFGAAFLLVGVLGFVPGITSNYDELKFAGNESEAELLGIFQVSILHNIVHLLFGVAGLAMARNWDTARTYLLGAGIIYVVLFLYGLLVGEDTGANFVPVNSADDLLHLVLALGLLGGYYASRRDTDVGRSTVTT